MQTYESICIIRSETGDENINEKVSEIEDILKKHNSEILKLENWGKKRLAYRIKKGRNGVYLYIVYKAAPDMVVKIERGLKLKEYIMKYITIKCGGMPADNINVQSVVSSINSDETTHEYSDIHDDESFVGSLNKGDKDGKFE